MLFQELPNVTVCQFQAGEYLIKMEDKVEYIYYLINGTVYREMICENGRECILSIKNNSELVKSLIGVLVIYNKKLNNISNYNFIAKTNCTCYKIPIDVCRDYFFQHPKLLEDLIDYAIDLSEQTLEMLQSRVDGNSVERLCKILLENIKLYEDGTITFEKLSNLELAKRVNINKDTVSRILHTLKNENVIEKVGGCWYITDIARLEKYANAELILHYKKDSV